MVVVPGLRPAVVEVNGDRSGRWDLTPWPVRRSETHQPAVLSTNRWLVLMFDLAGVRCSCQYRVAIPLWQNSRRSRFSGKFFCKGTALVWENSTKMLTINKLKLYIFTLFFKSLFITPGLSIDTILGISPLIIIYLISFCSFTSFGHIFLNNEKQLNNS